MNPTHDEPAMHFRHLRAERDADGVLRILLDRADRSTNTLSSELLGEFERLLDELERRPPAGLIIASAKAAGFAAGAEIEEFRDLASADDARALVARGWHLFNRLAGAAYPTLALIRGHCLGGGLELALACRHRVAVDEPGTRLALPEVMLGIVPAWGGMARLPALIGPAAALDLMLTGRSVDARRARRLGLVDECVPARVMDAAVRGVLRSGRAPHRPALLQRVLNGPLRGVVASRARKQLAARAKREHYPAPHALVDIWARFDGNALRVPASAECSLEAIFASPTARNLLRVFFLQERLKAFGKSVERPLRHVHVVGAGAMGGDIAAWCALRGLRVSLQDRSVEQIAPAIARANRLFERRLRGDARALRDARDRLVPDPAGAGVARADLIIEAIVEDLEIKRALFGELERRASPQALLASNTSSLRIEDLAAALADPSRLVGIHFFNPVARLPLVEVVHGECTDPGVAAAAAAFVRAIDKLPLPVRSAPGFLVNAALAPYMLEAMRWVECGMAPEVVDKALEDFGMPVGPIELVDRVGLDVALAAGRQLVGDSGEEPPRRLLDLVAAGRLGRKSGSGFYPWADGKAQKQPAYSVPEGVAERVVERLLRATRRCVDDGVVADADLADAGLIFGAGFAPYTGGPMHYLQTRGPTDDGLRRGELE